MISYLCARSEVEASKIMLLYGFLPILFHPHMLPWAVNKTHGASSKRVRRREPIFDYKGGGDRI